MQESRTDDTPCRSAPDCSMSTAEFLGQPRTGVQRYAMELLRQWDQMLAEEEIDGARNDIVVLTPPAKHRKAAIPEYQACWRSDTCAEIFGSRSIFPALPAVSDCSIHATAPRGSSAAGRWSPSTTLQSLLFRRPIRLQFRLKHQLIYRRLAATARPIITVSEFSRRRVDAMVQHSGGPHPGHLFGL